MSGKSYQQFIDAIVELTDYIFNNLDIKLVSTVILCVSSKDFNSILIDYLIDRSIFL